MQVHAHGGHIVHLEDLYLWYGASQKLEIQPGLWASEAVNLYTAHQLGGPWRYKGIAINLKELEGQMPEGAGPAYG